MKVELFEHKGTGYMSAQDPGEPGYQIVLRRTSITDEEGRLLSALVRDRKVLEIGTGLGVSTRYLAATAYHLTTVDTDPWVQACIHSVLTDVTCLQELPSKGEWDVVFVDGNHVKDQAVKDVRWALEHVVKGGLVIVHDINHRNERIEVNEALDEVGEKVYRVENTYGGLGVIVK